ncbi:hypothetical protein SISNIDRAFT_482943 [Sistotremastrum niveocremeum HHB9708]|uniref:Uncharacterized protein n=1 Tax=Sistotremastrum niveocremeum HHB9708 TaxID=1314777 RepID=A0A164XWS6_9AGAM|nr:hypothetical protein SISNIDRAFT_482943 [Sistotremastrum niveocremeum HHB9708]
MSSQALTLVDDRVFISTGLEGPAGPAQIFAQHLLYHGHGFPSWTPSPNTYVLVPGDLGYIDGDGRFIRLFNVMLSKDAPENQRDAHSPPDGFQPFQPFEAGMDWSTNLLLSIQSESGPKLFTGRTHRSRAAAASASAPASLLQLGASFSFSRSRYHSAALRARDWIKYDMTARYSCALAEYIVCNLELWKKVIHEIMRDYISLSDLVFITGCSNTREWEVGTFDSNYSQFGVGMQVQGIADISLSNERLFEHAASSKSGPDSLRARPPRQEVPWNEDSIFSDRDQTVFLKGWRIKERKASPLRRLKGGAGPHTLPKNPDQDNDDNGRSIAIDTFPHAEESNQRLTIYDEVMDHYLNCSDADVVLTHDDEIGLISKAITFCLYLKARKIQAD